MINGNYINYMNFLGIMKEGNNTRHADNKRGYGKHFIRGSDRQSDNNSLKRYLNNTGGDS